MVSKYRAKKVEMDGIKFDSKMESMYYKELKEMEQTHKILFFRLQPRYLLQDPFEKDGVKRRKIEYVGDFEVHHIDGSIETIDVKGAPPTEVFKLKRKLFDNKYPHKLTVITYQRDLGGWILYEEYERQQQLAKKRRKSLETSKRTEARNPRMAKKSHSRRVRYPR